MQWCLFCGKPNQPSSTFCIHCGRSLDEDSVREYARGLDYDAPQDYSEITTYITHPDGRFSPRKLLATGRTLEFVLGVALLLGIVGFAVYFSVQQSTYSGHYNRGQAAEARIDYDLALAEYSAAGDYRDAATRSASLRERLAERDKAYTIAEQYRKDEKWWLAATALRKVEGLQPNYKDTRSQLANARRVNGVVLYKQAASIEGDYRGGIYLSYADGGDPVLLPYTDQHSTVLAVSADSRWVSYAVGNGFAMSRSRVVYLYDVATRLDYRLGTPFEPFTNTPVARFTADSQEICVDVSGTGTCYALPFLGEYAELPRPLAARIVEELRPVEHQLVIRPVRLFEDALLGDGTEVYVTSKGPHLLETTRPVATEMGRVDGAVFSSNGDFLLYRLCGPIDLRRSYACSLRLVDLTQKGLYAYTVARLATPAITSQEADLTGAFTRDGRHVLIVQKDKGATEVRLYTLNSGDTWTLGAEASRQFATAAAENLLLPLGSPGLAEWVGRNALTHTDRGIALPEPVAGWLPRSFGRARWVSASPDDRYLLYLDSYESPSPDSGSAGIGPPVIYTLYSAPFRATIGSSNGETTHRLIRSLESPGRWLSSIYMLPDGRTLLSTERPNPGDKPGLYAYDLQTGEPTLAIPEATDLWGPGFYTLQPELPTFVPVTKQASSASNP